MNRQNNCVAPHAKGESSPSPSYSENSDLISSIKKSSDSSSSSSSSKVNSSKNKQSKHKQQSNSNESDAYVIKNDYESGSVAAGNSTNPAKEMADYMVTSASMSKTTYNRHEINCADSVDCSSVHSKHSSTSVHAKNTYKIEYKYSKNSCHADGALSSPTSSSSTTSNSGELPLLMVCLTLFNCLSDSFVLLFGFVQIIRRRPRLKTATRQRTVFLCQHHRHLWPHRLPKRCQR